MKFTLNIGLVPSENVSRKECITRAEVERVLRMNGFAAHTIEVRESDTEPTAVVHVENAPGVDVWLAFYRVSVALCQDCIAVVAEWNGRGALIGPRAAQWGEFNPAYFLPLADNDNEPRKAVAA